MSTQPASQPVQAAARPAQPARPAAATADKPRQQAMQASGGDAGDEDEYEEEEDGEFRGAMAELLPSGLTSMIVHIVILLALALWMIEPPKKPKEPDLVASTVDAIEEEEEEIFEDDITLDEPEEVFEQTFDKSIMPDEITVADTTIESEFNDLQGAEAVPDLALPVMTDFGPLTDAVSTQMQTHKGGHAVSGRGRMQRAMLVRSEGGTPQSEKAVEDALAWFARNQVPDGGWDFAPNAAVRGGTCDGDNKSRTAATAMALLPYLGAGYTHMEGKYKTQVWGGLDYLIKRMKPHPESRGGSLIDGGRNYDHGLALIALAEAYAMTQDSRLRGPVVAATNFSLYAQDPTKGGWMYGPRQGGDTSVTGWHVMGLKSAAMAKIPVPKASFAMTNKWLQSVSWNSGASYGYRKPNDRSPVGATTAAGHLCLMYMGRGQDDPALQRGVAAFAKKGPDLGDLYYTYYASQILHHMGGDKWKAWNERTRDPLIAKQTKAGDAKGSWKLTGHDHGFKTGGRLYTTSLATMILEVYYRHMPLYKEKGKEAGELEGWDLE
ncbi:MAG: hypothetical protein MI757_02360 [Pirellulales bacterium]|nr:hypothetical protein [Pirellulales bacterium]